MRSQKINLGIFLLLGTVQVWSQSNKELEKALRQTLVGKLSFLKVPYTATRLHFDQSGRQTATSEIGPWTTYGIVAIRDIGVTDDTLKIRAERAVAVLRKTKAGTQLVPTLISQPLSIMAELPQGTGSERVKAAASVVLQGGNMEERLQAYWRPNWDLTEPREVEEREHPDGIIGILEGERKVYVNISSIGIQPPKPIHTPDPEYTEEARRNHTQGTATLELIINEKGFPEILEVSRSLGNGLDINALAAVAQWRFQPASKNGVPVAVKISVQVTFRLG